MNTRTAHRLSALAVWTSLALSLPGFALIYGGGHRTAGLAVTAVAMVALLLRAVLTHRYPQNPDTEGDHQ